MDVFTEMVVARVRAARARVERAARDRGTFGLREALDELEAALLLARSNGIEVPPIGGDDGTTRG
ncbi:hypothetical protein GXW83_22430 [Streptacidiphilus sp. PB12-B1b]|uniref:hypothetical protein n=1 Tax=Streptacidiphilus sp. PB12-B1b TaxID=2705012 RepID=UPI0015F9A462|nr:hypothetical protein [Streptacidiphilus sp. PB12-B1b]QMU78044.1 hypothetical protein GXW83_22430 [Streptacidiphilus sp. PB12-B1b]